jgi:hypothetical protein
MHFSPQPVEESQKSYEVQLWVRGGGGEGEGSHCDPALLAAAAQRRGAYPSVMLQ